MCLNGCLQVKKLTSLGLGTSTHTGGNMNKPQMARCPQCSHVFILNGELNVRLLQLLRESHPEVQEEEEEGTPEVWWDEEADVNPQNS